MINEIIHNDISDAPVAAAPAVQGNSSVVMLSVLSLVTVVLSVLVTGVINVLPLATLGLTTILPVLISGIIINLILIIS